MNLILLSASVDLLRVWTASVLWNWFVVPTFDAPVLTARQWLPLALLLTLLAPPKSPTSDAEARAKATERLAQTLLILVLALALHLLPG